MTGSKPSGTTLLSVNRLACSPASDVGKPLLDEITFHINQQEHTAIIGPTGAGKSTLLACILRDTNKLAGLQQTGRIDYNQHNLLTLSSNDEIWVNGGICWIPQEPEAALNPTKNVKAQLLEMICARLKNSASAAEKLLRKNFELAGYAALFGALERYPAQFSGGELQRILILHALVGTPALVVADEPTTALDEDNKLLIMSLLMKLITASGATLLMSSHDYAGIRQYCKRFICLENGKLIETGPMSQLDNRRSNNILTALLRDDAQLHLGQPKRP